MSKSINADAVNFNILFVTDNSSKSFLFRGENVLKNFVKVYGTHSDIKYTVILSDKLNDFSENDVKSYNVIWLDNISDIRSGIALGNIMNNYLNLIDSSWKQKYKELLESDKESANKLLEDLNTRRQERVRIIYSLDEFVWEAPAGRSYTLTQVQTVESLISLSDTLIIPTYDMHDLITDKFKVVRDDMDIMVIDTAVSPEFLPLYKDFTRTGNYSYLRDKPRILVKGLVIPDNVQEFVMNNYKKFDITISSVGELNDHIMGLMTRKKVSNIMHWANPYVNKYNLVDTMAIERDYGFDVVIHCSQNVVMENGDNDDVRKKNTRTLANNAYSLSLGDEDILFSIAYGAIPICQTNHLEYEDFELQVVSGYSFNEQTPANYFKGIINEVTSLPAKYNEVYAKCKQGIEKRLTVSTEIIAEYYKAMVGPEVMKKAQEMLAKKLAEKELVENEAIQSKNDSK